MEDKYKKSIITIDPLEEEFAKPQEMSTAKLPMYKTAQAYFDDNKLSDDITMILDWPQLQTMQRTELRPFLFLNP